MAAAPVISKHMLPIRFLRLIPVVAFLFALFAASSQGQPPATIYLIRHAEKLTDGREDLSQQGFLRAALLPNLFLSPQGSGRAPLPRPEFLFATRQSKRSNRPFETVLPLSSALNLPISHEFDSENYADLAKLILGGGYAGRILLVSWHHGTLPQFATALGATPPYIWPETQFDRVWRIDYVAGKAKITDLPQNLLPDDSK